MAAMLDGLGQGSRPESISRVGFEYWSAFNADQYRAGGAQADLLSRLGFECALKQTARGRVYRLRRTNASTLSYLQSELMLLFRRKPNLRRVSFHLVRHAETRHNQRGLLAGSLFDPGASLATSGRERLRALRLPDNALLFHSSLTRARESAICLAETCHGTVIPTRYGNEMMFGSFEGQPLERLVAHDPAFARLYLDGDVVAGFPGAECLADVVVRAGFLVDEIVECVSELDRPEIDIVFVGHAIINQALRMLANDLLDEGGWYVCDGMSTRYHHMANADTMQLLDLHAESPSWTQFEPDAVSLS